jgi:hypothetical protein
MATEHTPRTLKALAREALDVQDACNLSGVVRTFARVVGDLWSLANAAGGGTEWVNRHPVSKVWVDKLASLAGVQNSFDDPRAAGDAFKKLEEIVRGEETLGGEQDEESSGPTAIQRECDRLGHVSDGELLR